MNLHKNLHYVEEIYIKAFNGIIKTKSKSLYVKKKSVNAPLNPNKVIRHSFLILKVSF